MAQLCRSAHAWHGEVLVGRAGLEREWTGGAVPGLGASHGPELLFEGFSVLIPAVLG